KGRSERARFFGPGDHDVNLNSDFAYLALGLRRRAAAELPTLASDARAMLKGYAAGYDAQLAHVGVAKVVGGCAGQPWVRPMSELDLWSYVKDVALSASGGQFIGAIATAQPPGAAPSPASRAAAGSRPAAGEQLAH